MPEFRFSLPQITALNQDQQLAYNPRASILVTGGPGSGKTVVTVFRFLRAVQERKNIVLFTYNKTLIYSIRGTLKEKAEELFGDFDEVVIESVVKNQLLTFFQWHKDNIGWFDPSCTTGVMAENFTRFLTKHAKFSEMFFDEGQDLPRAVFGNGFILSDIISVGADRAQNYRGYYENDEVEDVINEQLNAQQETDWQYLGANFRNTKEIFNLAQKFVPKDLRVQAMDSSLLRSGNNPEIILDLGFDQQLEFIKGVIEANLNSNIGILVHFKSQILKIKEYLESQGYSCAANANEDKSFSYYFSDMPFLDEQIMMNKLSTPFITTFDSCKGLEFDVVIIPFFEMSDWACTRTNNDGRNWATPNHYYVGVTRAKNDIFIICDKKPQSLSFYTPPVDDDLPF